MKVVKWIKMAITWTKKSLDLIKGIGASVLAVTLILSLFTNGCSKAKLRDTVQRLTGLELEVFNRTTDVSERDSLLAVIKIEKALVTDSLRKSEAELKRIQSLYGHLHGDYRELSGQLIEITSDSSYQFLQRIAYPFPGKLKYPFNEPQVKSIHLTYLEKNKLQEMNVNLVGQVQEYESQIELRDLTEEFSLESLGLMTETREDINKIIKMKDEIIQMKDDTIKVEERHTTFYKITTGAATVLLIICLL